MTKVIENIEEIRSHINGLSEEYTIPIFLAHSLGGGAEHYLNGRILASEEETLLVVRFGLKKRLRLEIYENSEIKFSFSTNVFQEIINLTDDINSKHIYFSNVCGDKNPIEIPHFIIQLSRECHLTFLIHDYFVISPNINLQNKNKYIADGYDTDYDFDFNNEQPNFTLKEWQNAWKDALLTSDTVEVFSENSKDIFLKHYPELSKKIIISPHQVAKIELPNTKKINLGILGNIHKIKGSKIVYEISKIINDEDHIKLILIGEMDKEYNIGGKNIIHGKYKRQEIGYLAWLYDVNYWLVPSIVPETFCYVAHECLQTKIPTFSFDIGAQAEAMRASKYGNIIEFNFEQNARDLAIKIVSDINLYIQNNERL